MGMEAIKEALPDYAKDVKLNLGSLFRTTELNKTQLWGCAVACALAARNPLLTKNILEDAAEHLSEAELHAAKGAGTIMGINNVFYRFRHFMEERDPEYSKMPARLRMNIIARHEAEKLDFELWSLAVSAINGCEMCVQAHEKVCRDKGASKATVFECVKIASVINAAAVALDAAAALAE